MELSRINHVAAKQLVYVDEQFVWQRGTHLCEASPETMH